MTTWTASVREATKFQLVQHVRNKFALILVLIFIPAWLTIIQQIIPGESIQFWYRPAGEMLTVDAARLAMISGAINADTLIIGFLMFAAVHRSADFDQRLVLAGYSRSALLTAKLIALVVSAAVVAGYAAAVMQLFWSPEQPWLLAASLFTSGMVYGGIGIALAVVFHSDLPGMFLIIMISLVDVMVQNPIINPETDGDLLKLLPSFGSMQAAVGAAFTEDSPARYLLIGAQWLAGLVLFGFGAFYLRTRDHAQKSEDTAPPSTYATATVVLSRGSDGSVIVRSTEGPITMCARLTAAEAREEDASCRCSPV